MSRHSLYKYFSDEQWAEDFLDGKVLFRSLAYFRDVEKDEARRDENEGIVSHSPEGGLIINNITRGTTFTLPNHHFMSSVNSEEILVFCLSRSLSEELYKSFGSFCVEVTSVKSFCTRIQAALPPNAKMLGRSHKPRIGTIVDYHDYNDGINPHWALPERMVTTKPTKYAWQAEYRLVFSLSDALGFEKVDTRIVSNDYAPRCSKPTNHRPHPVIAESLRDICQLHRYQR